MLLFDRPSFKSGVMIVKVTVDGTEYGFSLRPTQKGTEIDFGSPEIETALLAKYPSFFTAV